MSVSRLSFAAFMAAAILAVQAPAGQAHAAVPQTLIAQRAVAQQGLAIGLATIVLRSQGVAFAGAFFAVDNCTSLSGGGSWKVITQTIDLPKVIVRIKLYFDTECTNVYLDEKLTIENTAVSPPTYKLDATAQVYSKAGTKVGTLKVIDNSLSAPSSTTLKLVGRQNFKPVGANAPDLDMGINCELPRNTDPAIRALAQALLTPKADREIVCTAGVAQDFSAIGKATASLFKVALVIANDGKGEATFVQKSPAQLKTGPLGSLSVKVSQAGIVSIAGTSSPFGKADFSGRASRLVLFPEKPVEWTSVDAGHDTRFTVRLVNNTTRSLKGGLSHKNGLIFGPMTLDQSGSGTIEYSNGVTAPISSWVLEK